MPVTLEVVLENDGPAALGGFSDSFFVRPQPVTVITKELMRQQRVFRN